MSLPPLHCREDTLDKCQIRVTSVSPRGERPHSARAALTCDVIRHAPFLCSNFWAHHFRLFPFRMASEVKLQTAKFDARFPNTNQTKNCWTNFRDYHRCVKARGEDYEPCEWFKKTYSSLCPAAWVC